MALDDDVDDGWALDRTLEPLPRDLRPMLLALGVTVPAAMPSLASTRAAAALPCCSASRCTPASIPRSPLSEPL